MENKDIKEFDMYGDKKNLNENISNKFILIEISVFGKIKNIIRCADYFLNFSHFTILNVFKSIISFELYYEYLKIKCLGGGYVYTEIGKDYLHFEFLDTICGEEVTINTINKALTIINKVFSDSGHVYELKNY